jgi:hypothetical protein
MLNKNWSKCNLIPSEEEKLAMASRLEAPSDNEPFNVVTGKNDSPKA